MKLTHKRHQLRPRIKIAHASMVVLTFLNISVGKPSVSFAESKVAEPKAEREKVEAKAKFSDEAIKRYGIVTAAVKKESLTASFNAPARIAFNAEAMAHVGAVVRGRAVELKVRRGDKVKEGDALVVVESPDLGEAQSDLLQKRTAFEIAGPAADLAKESYGQAKRLFDESQGISQSELRKRQLDYQSAVGAAKTAEAARIAAENRLHLLGMDQAAIASLLKTGEINPRYTITAPIGGQVTQREVTLGELVSPEKEALLVIANSETLWVLADVPEAMLARVKVGSKAGVSVSASGVSPISGTVSFIDPALDPDTRTARVRIVIKGDEASVIRPGMFAQADIAEMPDATNQRATLAVPDEAVQTIDGEPTVFVPVPGEMNTFSPRHVVLGPAVGPMLPVRSGLKEGEEIAVAGTFPIKAEIGKGAAEED